MMVNKIYNNKIYNKYKIILKRIKYNKQMNKILLNKYFIKLIRKYYKVNYNNDYII